MKKIILFILLSVIITGCKTKDTAATQESKNVDRQQDQYSKGQPIPVFDWSLERDLLIKLYTLRNQKVATHAVWRSDYGMIEGDCPSIGYGLPYDVSLTNPLATTDEDQKGYSNAALAVIEQPEPNGLFASKNTSATWVMCVGETGTIEPVYVESKVTVYPGPVNVNYAANKVTKAGAATAKIDIK